MPGSLSVVAAFTLLAIDRCRALITSCLWDKNMKLFVYTLHVFHIDPSWWVMCMGMGWSVVS